MWKNPSAITSAKAGAWWRPLENTIESSRPARNAEATRVSRMRSLSAVGQIGSDLHGEGLVLQAAVDRTQGRCRRCQGFDYDIWHGPAPKHAFNPNRFHYNWHWFWDYGNGDLGNQGIHQMDLCTLGSRQE